MNINPQEARGGTRARSLAAASIDRVRALAGTRTRPIASTPRATAVARSPGRRRPQNLMRVRNKAARWSRLTTRAKCPSEGKPGSRRFREREFCRILRPHEIEAEIGRAHV